MKRKYRNTSSAPTCVFCHRAQGVQFAIFNPRFAPFGTACVECEATLPPGTEVPEPFVPDAFDMQVEDNMRDACGC